MVSLPTERHGALSVFGQVQLPIGHLGRYLCRGILVGGFSAMPLDRCFDDVTSRSSPNLPRLEVIKVK